MELKEIIEIATDLKSEIAMVGKATIKNIKNIQKLTVKLNALRFVTGFAIGWGGYSLWIQNKKIKKLEERVKELEIPDDPKFVDLD